MGIKTIKINEGRKCLARNCWRAYNTSCGKLIKLKNGKKAFAFFCEEHWEL